MEEEEEEEEGTAAADDEWSGLRRGDEAAPAEAEAIAKTAERMERANERKREREKPFQDGCSSKHGREEGRAREKNGISRRSQASTSKKKKSRKGGNKIAMMKKKSAGNW